jgi:hypothetical protein
MLTDLPNVAPFFWKLRMVQFPTCILSHRRLNVSSSHLSDCAYVTDHGLIRDYKTERTRITFQFYILYHLVSGMALSLPPTKLEPSLAPPFCANQSRNWNMLALGCRSSDVWLRYCIPNLTWLPANHSKLS